MAIFTYILRKDLRTAQRYVFRSFPIIGVRSIKSNKYNHAIEYFEVAYIRYPAIFCTGPKKQNSETPSVTEQAQFQKSAEWLKNKNTQILELQRQRDRANNQIFHLQKKICAKDEHIWQLQREHNNKSLVSKT